MQTITFYSYKGGVGRTLALANVAKYLARFGQRVFVLDFDLEAPGLHYKLLPAGPGPQAPITLGVLDYLHAFAMEGNIPASLQEYVIEIERREEGTGSIHLMPAGNVPSAHYWRRLAQINWHELFYSEGARGIPFFLEFKERIEQEFAPDFLLIDSRTGITEIGGVATSVIPDRVVCLLLNNRENMEGAREVLRSITRAQRLPGQDPVEILPVVTRIPEMETPEVEERIVQQIRDFLNEEAEELADTLDLPEVLVLHSEPALEISESLRIGGDKTPDESPLLRDYLRLFTRLTSREVIEPHVDQLIEDTLKRVLDDPEGVQRDLEALTAHCSHPGAYHALLKFYRLRQVGDAPILRTAFRLWELTGRADDPILWEVVREHFEEKSSREERLCSPEFIEAVWSAAGSRDEAIGLKLAEFFNNLDRKERATAVLLRLLHRTGPIEKVAVASIDQLREAEQWEAASEVVDQCKSALRDSAKFQVAWARLVVGKEDSAAVLRLLETEDFRFQVVKEEDLPTCAVLLDLAGRTDELDVMLEQALTQALRRGFSPSRYKEEIGEVAQLYRQLGRWRQFEERARESLGSREAEELLDYAERMSRRLF